MLYVVILVLEVVDVRAPVMCAVVGKVVGKAVENDDEDLMVEVVVVDVVGGSWQTGDGSQPCCPAMMPPGVVGEVAAVGEDVAAGAAAAACSRTSGCLARCRLVAVAAAVVAAAVAAMATTTTDLPQCR